MKEEQNKEELIKELEIYLDDFDNLKDCNFFSDRNIEEYTHNRNENKLNHFLSTGREYIRKYLMMIKLFNYVDKNDEEKEELKYEKCTIKVISCKKDYYWYADSIGVLFDVIKTPKDGYQYLTKNETHGYIAFEDAIEVDGF